MNKKIGHNSALQQTPVQTTY